MNREFFINIAFLITINLLIKPFYIFGIDRSIQNRVEAGEYGIYFALLNFTFLLQIINDFGIQNFNNRTISQHRHLLEKYFPNILILKGILGLVYLLMVGISAWLLGYWPLYSNLLIFLCLNWILISLILFLRSNIAGLAMYRTDSLLSVLDKMLLIIVCGILLWANPIEGTFQIEWFVYAQTFTLSCTAMIAFLLVYKQLQSLRFRFQKAFLFLILKQSYPYALVVFLMTLYARIDGVMIERMLPNGKLEADIYASAYRLLEASNILGFLFAGLLLPMFARMIKGGEAVGELVRFSLQMIWAGAITLAFATYFFQEEIMVLLYWDGSTYSGKILGWLMMSFIAVTGSYIYGTLLTANGSLMKMNLIFIISVGLNIFLNYWLILQYQALGAAAASCFTQFFVLIAQIILAKHLLQLPTNIRLIVKIGGFALVVFLMNYVLFYYAWKQWIWGFLSSLILGTGLSFLFKLVDLKGLVELLKNKNS